jgi:hypothetical protein
VAGNPRQALCVGDEMLRAGQVGVVEAALRQQGRCGQAVGRGAAGQQCKGGARVGHAAGLQVGTQAAVTGGGLAGRHPGGGFAGARHGLADEALQLGFDAGMRRVDPHGVGGTERALQLARLRVVQRRRAQRVVQRLNLDARRRGFALDQRVAGLRCHVQRDPQQLGGVDRHRRQRKGGAQQQSLQGFAAPDFSSGT